MATEQRSDLDRAIARAHRDGIRIAAHGRVHGQRAFWVTSASRPTREHLVTVTDGQLVCHCSGGWYGPICTHHALVHERLVTERSR